MNNAFRENIEKFKEQLTLRGVILEQSDKLKNNYDSIVIIGMGGSALAGDLLALTAQEIGLKLPVLVWKDYGLPSHIPGKNPLYIFASFSGNTEETLSGLNLLLKRKMGRNIALVTTGGELRRLAKAHALPLARFPARTLTPRQSIGNIFYSLIKILQAAHLRLNVSSYDTLSIHSVEKAGLALARKLYKRLIVIYTDHAHLALAYIWKIKFNETAKSLAFMNVVPEMNHNELVSLSHPQLPTTALFLTPPKLAPRLKKRFALNSRLIKSNKIPIINVPLNGRKNLEQAWRTIMLADWTSYHLAKLRKLDPQETRIIDTLKNALAS